MGNTALAEHLRKLLYEMMLSGNFGQYDQRGAKMKNGGMLKHGLGNSNALWGQLGVIPKWHYGSHGSEFGIICGGKSM